MQAAVAAVMVAAPEVRSPVAAWLDVLFAVVCGAVGAVVWVVCIAGIFLRILPWYRVPGPVANGSLWTDRYAVKNKIVFSVLCLSASTLSVAGGRPAFCQEVSKSAGPAFDGVRLPVNWSSSAAPGGVSQASSPSGPVAPATQDSGHEVAHGTPVPKGVDSIDTLVSRMRAADPGGPSPSAEVVREFVPGYQGAGSVSGATVAGTGLSLPPGVAASPAAAGQTAGRSLAGGLPRPVSSGCLDRGAGTVLEPSCLSRLAPVPQVISRDGGGVPLPDLSVGAGVSQADLAPVAPVGPVGQVSLPVPSPVEQMSGRALSTPVGSAFSSAGADSRLACAIADGGGLVSTLRVADVRSCVVAGTEMLAASYGPFSLTMVDSFGTVVAVSCRAYGSAARPVCSRVD